jgi:hypothetical protein
VVAVFEPIEEGFAFIVSVIVSFALKMSAIDLGKDPEVAALLRGFLFRLFKLGEVFLLNFDFAQLNTMPLPNEPGGTLVAVSEV